MAPRAAHRSSPVRVFFIFLSDLFCSLGGVGVFFGVRDGSSLTYRPAWVGLGGPTAKNDLTAKQKTGSKTCPFQNPLAVRKADITLICIIIRNKML